MRSFRRAGFALIITLFVAGRAQAQSVAEPNTLTATPFVSVSFGTPSGLGSSLGIGGAIGYDLTSNIGFEFELGRVFDVAGGDGNLDYKLTTISGNAIYHFDVARVTPYAAVGLGWERTNPDFRNPAPLALTVGPSTEVAWNFGGGVKVPINDRLLARGDLRRFQVNDLAPDHWRLYGGVTFWIRR